MTTIAELILKADYRQVDQAEGSLDRLTSTGEKAVGTMTKLAATLGIAFGIREVVQAADAYNGISNRLKLVTSSTEQLTQAQEQLYKISQETRQPIEATAEVYQRLAQNAGALGLSLNDVGKTTETINKLVALSGASTEAANAALVQFGQGLASGALRGDELNSVIEQTPALAKAIAEGMGITIGQLRAMGQEGKITASAIIDALNKQGDAVNEQFGKLAPTIGQGMTMVENSFTRMIGKVDQASGASQALGAALGGISSFIDGPVLENATRLFATWGATFNDAANNADKLSGKLDGVGNGAKSISWYITNAFIEMPANVKAMIGITTTYIAAFVDDTSNRFERAKDRWNAIWTSSTWADAQRAYEARSKAIQSAKEASIDAILKERDAEIEAGNAKAAAAASASGTGALDTKGKPTGAKAIDPKEEERLKKEAERQQKWAEEQKIRWSNEINDELDKIAKQSENEQKAHESKLDRLRKEFDSEAELENAAYAKKLDDYAAYAEALGLSEEAQRAQREKFEADHVDRMRAIRTKEAQADKTGLANKLGVTQKFFMDMYNATGTHNQRLLKRIQVVGAAQAVANAYIAASQALADPSVPFFAKFAAVAQVLATGLGLANSIRSLNSSGSAAGGVSPSSSGPDTSGLTPATPQPRPQVVDFRIERRGRRGWDDEDVADLMKAMGDRVADGAKFGRVEFVTA